MSSVNAYGAGDLPAPIVSFDLYDVACRFTDEMSQGGSRTHVAGLTQAGDPATCMAHPPGISPVLS
jgi:hypothetical protein